MTIEDVKITIKNHILNSISHRDLCVLCNIFEIPTTGRRIQIQKRLIDSILVATNVDLLHRILYMINRSVNRDTNGCVNNSPQNQIISSQTRDAVQSYVQNGSIMGNNYEVDNGIGYNQMNGYNQRNVIPTLNSKLYCISNEILDKCPIDLRPEIINGVDPLNIFIPNYTKYPSGYFSAPSTSPTLINGRVNLPNVQLPYCVKNTVIVSSQFYCCQVVLHPLCLLIPKPTPNICQPTRVMSKMQLQFTLSSNARHLITAHRTQVDNKRIYKWQVLIRFGMYDPSKPFPNSSNESISHLPEYIPPYLTLFVNNVPVPLWDILPSNAPAKEGKRHPRPINISDHLKFSNSADELGYRQSINVNWWQTPGVYQYYYFAIYLERKLAVNELYQRFVNKTHHIQMPISFTINLIRDKFSGNNNDQFPKKLSGPDNNNDDDDDLVISSVLPISLLCPVGKSRITCPIRGVHCQHLQCFDANLYLMMNERRSVWKCPVCDAQATLNELFVDEFFLGILQQFAGNDTITEVNVNPDGSHVPVAVKESREHKQHIGNIVSNVEAAKEQHDEQRESSDSDDCPENQPTILLESDDDDPVTVDHPVRSSPRKSTSVVNSNSSVDSNAQPPKPSASGLTIDLTSDSDDDGVSKAANFSYNASKSSKASFPNNNSNNSISNNSNNNNITSNHSNSNASTSSSNQYSHMFSHSMHQPIVPKLPNTSSSYLKLTPAVPPANSYHPVVPSSSDSVIAMTNPYQSAINHPIASQPMNKMPASYMWMSQNQRFPAAHANDLGKCFIPQLKPIFPNTQNFVNMVRPPNTAYQPLSVVQSNSGGNTSGLGTPLLPRPIKTDPHQNLCVRFKDSRNYCNRLPPPLALPKTVPNSSHAHPSQSSSISDRRQRADLQKSTNRRSTRILNQHKKIYREKSISDEDQEILEYDIGDTSDDSDVLGFGGRKRRRNAFEDSTSSGSSVSNRKRRRLLPDASPPSPPLAQPPSSSSLSSLSSDGERYKSKQKLVLHQSDLKCPLVILHKLDPVVLQVYLRQNEGGAPHDDSTEEEEEEAAAEDDGKEEEGEAKEEEDEQENDGGGLTHSADKPTNSSNNLPVEIVHGQPKPPNVTVNGTNSGIKA